jgi:magnesium transporter
MLISCVLYRDGRKVADIAPEQIHRHVGEPNSFVWVALRDADPKTLEQMQAEFGLHPLAVEDARHGHQRPKIEEYGESLFAVLQIIEASHGSSKLGEMCVFVGPGYVLTVRTHADRGFHEVRERCEQEPELLRHGPGYVLYALMDAVVDRYFPILDGLEADLERIEERIFAADGSPRANIEALYALKRQLMTIRHAVAPLLEAVSALSGTRVPAICADIREYFRDIYDHLLRLNQTIDSIRDTVSTATAVNLSMVTLQESETMKRLAAYAALLATPTMIAGIYGMNFQHMPELGWKFGYAMAVGSMVLIDIYLFHRLRKAGWL